MNIYNKITNLFNKKTESYLPKTYVDFKKIIENYNNKRLDASRFNLKAYRSALYSAENKLINNREELNRFYNDAKIDADVYALIQLRKSATLNKKYNLYNINDELVENDQNYGLYNKIINLCLDSIFEGFKVFKICDIINNQITGIDVIDNYNVNISKHMLVPTNNVQEGIDYLNDPDLKNWVIEVFDTREDLGLLNIILQYYIQKQQIQSAFTTFTEISGAPFRVLKTDTTDERILDSHAQMLAGMASNPWMITNNTDELLFVDSQKGNKGEVYIAGLKYFNECIAKIIVGGTMLITDGSSHSQSKVHENNFKRIIAADLAYVENKMNIILEQLSFFTNEKLTFKFDSKEELTLNEQFVFDLEFIKNGFSLNIDYLNNKYNTQIIR